jgi:hypothetical protein
MREVTYKPPGTVSREFMRDDSFFRGIMGPFGSGKSTCCIMEVLRRAQMQRPSEDGKRRSRWAIIRNTYPELKTTTIKSWHEWVPQHIGRWVDAGPPMHHIQDGDLDLEVLFLALDRPQDVGKLLSMQLTGAWINEAREVSKAVLDGLTGRVGRYPAGGTAWSGIIADTNPPDNDHWWYKLAEEQKPSGWRFFRQPSGLAQEAENLEWLNQTPESLTLPPEHPVRRAQGRGYYERQISGKDQDWVNVYVHSEYGFVRDGRPVYPEFKDSVHVAEFNLIPGVPLYVGIDFGLTPAATIAQRTPLGQWRVHGELVTEDMGAVRFGQLLHSLMQTEYAGFAFEKITGDPAGDTRAQTDEVTPFQILRAQKVFATPAATNDFIKRRESVASPLNRLIDGVPGLVIHPRCALLRKAMAGGYAYKRLQVTGEERFRDVPDKNHYSHVAESLQYLLVGGGEAALLTKRSRTGTRASHAVMN